MSPSKSSSRSSSASTSRGPTPSPSPRAISAKSDLKSQISRISHNDKFFYAFFGITSLLIIVSSNFVPSYCIENHLCMTNCQKCPENARCELFSFTCIDGFKRVGHNCIPSDEEVSEEILLLSKRITDCINANSTKTLEQLSQQLDESPLTIRTAIQYTDYRIDRDSIVRIYKMNIIRYAVLAILSFMSLTVTTVMFVFRREKNEDTN